MLYMLTKCWFILYSESYIVLIILYYIYKSFTCLLFDFYKMCNSKILFYFYELVLCLLWALNKKDGNFIHYTKEEPIIPCSVCTLAVVNIDQHFSVFQNHKSSYRLNMLLYVITTLYRSYGLLFTFTHTYVFFFLLGILPRCYTDFCYPPKSVTIGSALLLFLFRARALRQTLSGLM